MTFRTNLGARALALAAVLAFAPMPAFADRDDGYSTYNREGWHQDGRRGHGGERNEYSRERHYGSNSDDEYRRGYEDAQRDAERRRYGNDTRRWEDAARARAYGYGYGDRYGQGYRQYGSRHEDYRQYSAYPAPWDPRAHNGYYYRDAWYWGAPPQAYYRDCRPGYRALQRGARIPRGYNVYVVEDWNRYGLYAPPRGHRWARDDRGEYYLLGIATGVIVDQLLRGW